MNIALYSRPHPNRKPEEFSTLLQMLESYGFHYQLNREFARQLEEMQILRPHEMRVYDNSTDIHPDTEVMVSYGGDGTFLEAVRILDSRPVPVVGINSGRLGFLANITKHDMATAFEEIKKGRFTCEERTLLEVRGDFPQQPDFPYAFNEFAIQRQGTSMVMTEVFVDGEMIATCHGDGMLVSTPSGSTAYSLSVGGPVVAPSCHCFIISPIAPHNLTLRPVVIPDTSRVTLKVYSREPQVQVSLDNQNYFVPSEAAFEVLKAKKSVFLVRLQNISFYDTLRKKMNWGIDHRDYTK